MHSVCQSTLNSQPRISIITTTLNAEATIEATILSVATQSYRNFEHIIIDGGSTDRTLELIRQHANKLSYWVSEPDSGIYDAMNKGISRSTGDWLYFLGADDILLNCLHRVVPALTDAHTIYYGDVYMPAAHIFVRWPI